jgi:hypothetical protein
MAMDEIYFESWYIPLLWICFLTSLTVYFQKDTPPWLKYFPPFILITVIVEMAGQKIGSTGINNVWLYNSYSTLEIPFYLLVLRANVKTKTVKILIAYSAGLYLIVQIMDFILLKIYEIHYLIYNFGAILVVIFCVYYFYRLSRSDKASGSKYDPMFWICTGMTIYYTGSLPIWVLYGNIEKVPFLVVVKAMQIHVYLNLAFYSMFIIGFLCRFSLRRT